MATRAPSPRLRGREVELGALGEAFDQAALGHPAIVLVEGEAGIGKTRMLAEDLDDARARGLEVVSGRAQELERTRPFGVLASMFASRRTVQTHLAHVVTKLGISSRAQLAAEATRRRGEA